MIRGVVLHAPSRALRCVSKQWPIRNRQFASTAASGTANSAASDLAVVAGLAADLDRHAPRIDLHPDAVHILASPKEFYGTLLRMIRSARRRIFLSTLYIGKTEHELINALKEALGRNPELQVSILTDALRGTREAPAPSCASLLVDLVQAFPQQVQVCMYHTPNLVGWRKRLIPRRINEGWGLQHMKLYGVDDEIVLSGANLSEDYFTNRQDRYHLLSSSAATDYFEKIHQTMCHASFTLQPSAEPSNFRLEWPSTNNSPSPLENPRGYIEATRELFAPFTRPAILPSRKPPDPTASQDVTALYPVLVIPQTINTELPLLLRLLGRRAPETAPASFLFTAGYFNPDPGLVQALLSAAAHANASTASQRSRPSEIAGTVLTASPWANGFYRSPGISGMLPGAYTILSCRFLQAVSCYAPGAVELREWRLGTVGRPHGWTYHAKGIWLRFAGLQEEQNAVSSNTGPMATLVGSSNYTKRSYTLDTEVGALLLTSNARLRQRLKDEEANLLQHSKGVSEADLHGGERRVGLGTRIAMGIVQLLGGAL